VVVTNPAASGVTQQIEWSLRREGSHASVLAGSYRAEALREGDARAQSPAMLSGRRVVALAGLASPASFVATLASLGASVVELLAFPDHHPYGETDLERVRLSVQRSGAEWVVTTEKDWMRLRDAPSLGVPLKVLSIRLDMGSERATLVDALARTLRSKAAGRTSP
jgi:tetraacyldisaccharide 4'-kinase